MKVNENIDIHTLQCKNLTIDKYTDECIEKIKKRIFNDGFIMYHGNEIKIKNLNISYDNDYYTITFDITI